MDYLLQALLHCLHAAGRDQRLVVEQRFEARLKLGEATRTLEHRVNGGIRLVVLARQPRSGPTAGASGASACRGILPLHGPGQQ